MRRATIALVILAVAGCRFAPRIGIEGPRRILALAGEPFVPAVPEPLAVDPAQVTFQRYGRVADTTGYAGPRRYDGRSFVFTVGTAEVAIPIERLQALAFARREDGLIAVRAYVAGEPPLAGVVDPDWEIVVGTGKERLIYPYKEISRLDLARPAAPVKETTE